MRKRLRLLSATAILAGMMFVPLGCSSSGPGGTGPNQTVYGWGNVYLQSMETVPELHPKSEVFWFVDGTRSRERKIPMTWDGEETRVVDGVEHRVYRGNTKDDDISAGSAHNWMIADNSRRTKENGAVGGTYFLNGFNPDMRGRLTSTSGKGADWGPENVKLRDEALRHISARQETDGRVTIL